MSAFRRNAAPGRSVAPITDRSAAHLSIKSVRRAYGELEAIRDVSFDVAAEEFLSVLGPSGCGKTTLLMMLAGVLSPTAGEIIINGEKVNGPRREIGVVFQNPVLLPWRSVLDNVLLPVQMLRAGNTKHA